MIFIWGFEGCLVAPGVGHRLLCERMGFAKCPWFSQEQSIPYQSTPDLPSDLIFEIVARPHDVS